MNNYDYIIDFFKKVGCMFLIYILLNIPNCFIEYSFIIHLFIILLSFGLGYLLYFYIESKKSENDD